MVQHAPGTQHAPTAYHATDAQQVLLAHIGVEANMKRQATMSSNLEWLMRKENIRDIEMEAELI
jgi:hypothetical protein